MLNTYSLPNYHRTPLAIMLRHFEQRLLEDLASVLIAQSPDTPISLAPVDSTGIWWINWVEFFISSPLTSEGQIEQLRESPDTSLILMPIQHAEMAR